MKNGRQKQLLKLVYVASASMLLVKERTPEQKYDIWRIKSEILQACTTLIRARKLPKTSLEVCWSQFSFASEQKMNPKQ